MALCIVGIDLVIITAIRHRYFGTPLWLSGLQVVGGGLLVLIAGWLFGSA